MEIHPLCQTFPEMSAEEYKALSKDIRDHGLLEPIWTHEGLIVDGPAEYGIRWDDGTTNRKRLYAHKRPTIEALEPPPPEGSGTGDAAELEPHEARVLEALGDSPEGLTSWEIGRKALGGHRRVREIRAVLGRLQARGLVERGTRPTDGRPSVVWALAVAPDGEGG
jgi:hypothetical protein